MDGANEMIAKFEINKLLLLLALAIFFDGFTTLVAFTIGLQEGNPLAVMITPQVSLLVRAAIVGYFYWRFTKYQPTKYTYALLWVAITWTWIVVANNISLIIYKTVMI